jgi:hypothetical protein
MRDMALQEGSAQPGGQTDSVSVLFLYLMTAADSAFEKS